MNILTFVFMSSVQMHLKYKDRQAAACLQSTALDSIQATCLEANCPMMTHRYPSEHIGQVESAVYTLGKGPASCFSPPLVAGLPERPLSLPMRGLSVGHARYEAAPAWHDEVVLGPQCRP